MKQRIGLLTVLVLVFPTFLFAQDFRGAITGTIADATGGVGRALVQRVRGDMPKARLNLALATGVMTRRAYVGRREVARSRFEETSAG